MAALGEIAKSDGAASAVAALDADGAVIVHDFLAPDLLARFRADMEAHAAGHREGTVSDVITTALLIWWSALNV